MDRRYSDAEVAELLSAAAQRESGGGKDGWTADQVLAMAAELGIDGDSVRAEFDRSKPAKEQSGGTTELSPGLSGGIGVPKGVVLRRRLKGQLPGHALDDVAEDARRTFNKVRRLERRPDELLVEGTFEGTEASVIVEVGPRYSSIEMHIEFTRRARIIHYALQVTAFFVALMIATNQYGPFFENFVIPLVILSVIAFGLAAVIATVTSRRIVARAEKVFELQSNRAARMLYVTSALIVDEEPGSQKETSGLHARLRPQA